MELAQQKCTTYRAGSPPLTRKETFALLNEVPGWSLDNGHLTRMFALDDSDRCVEFFIEVMALSSQEGQIPDICMKESRFVEISYYTYPAGGLTLNDFIIAKLTRSRRTIFVKSIITFLFQVEFLTIFPVLLLLDRLVIRSRNKITEKTIIIIAVMLTAWR
jgi:4a-hydroxytetrahydrobiopterin dehydratase